MVTAVLLTFMMRLWRASLSSPFYYSGDAVGSAEYFKSVMETGWYEYQPALGAPYGQHYHDFPFSDDLNPVMAKVLGFLAGNWAVAFNLYYLLGFLLCALTAVWFLRVCGLSPWMTVTMSVLFALAPYHFIRNEGHLFLASYYCVPLALVVLVRAARGERLWGVRALTSTWATARRRPAQLLGLLTGRGAGTVLILVLVTYSGAYYGLFTALLLAPIGLLTWVRSRNGRRFLGAVAAGAVLAATFVLALLPDLIYQLVTGSDGTALVRTPIAAEVYAFKFTSLILPAPGHPIPWLAQARSIYDNHYPLPSEEPALGLVAAIGFVMLLLLALLALTGTVRRTPTAAQEARRTTLQSLSALTWIAFMWGTVGGLGTVLSFVTASVRGWNRIAIFIALFALAALGLALEGLAARWSARRSGRSLRTERTEHTGDRGPDRSMTQQPARWVAALAVVVLLVGAGDQTISDTVPPYRATQAAFESDGVFVDALQARLPGGTMLFQLPYQAFPEGNTSNGLPESDQIKLYLHSSTLRWSAAGIKGRPQSDWPSKVATQTPATMTRNLAAIGFAGIVVHRAALKDHGKAMEASLRTLLGKPSLVSPDGSWSFLSLTPAIAALDATTTPAQRVAIAQAITHLPPGTN
ncbi:phosphoglycerol transferase [Nakamurella sp. UYEF19]|uniref:hypothetical protein n=1 Tax=Nakamurella sp. UYEF19 TaxID=1756392 RepID=UPI00339AB08F